LESAQFLAEKNFPNVPRFAGALELHQRDGVRTCLGILSGFIPDSKDGWSFTFDALRRYFDRVRTLPNSAREDESVLSLVELAERGVSASAAETVGTYFESGRLIGQRIGELHLALSSDPDNKDFAPEPFTPFYQRSLYQSLRNHLAFHFRVLRRELKKLPESVQPLAERVLAVQDSILGRYRKVYQTPMKASRIRSHGNLHLGHVLHTGTDFFIIDFEGEPAWTLSQRRIKRSTLRDIAGMIRSFHHVAEASLRHHVEAGNLREEQFRALQPWARFWVHQVSAEFLGAYLAAIAKSNLLPKNKPCLAALTEAFLLDQSIIEMSRELQRHSEGIRLPLEGILQILATADGHGN